MSPFPYLSISPLSFSWFFLPPFLFYFFSACLLLHFVSLTPDKHGVLWCFLCGNSVQDSLTSIPASNPRDFLMQSIDTTDLSGELVTVSATPDLDLRLLLLLLWYLSCRMVCWWCLADVSFLQIHAPWTTFAVVIPFIEYGSHREEQHDGDDAVMQSLPSK